MSTSWKLLVSTCLLGLLLGGCAQVQSLNQWLRGQSTEMVQVALELQVTPAGKAGTYTVQGKTSLPEQTQMRVIAVRYLRTGTQGTGTQGTGTQGTGTQGTGTQAGATPTFSILDSQTATVSQGQWQSSLNLWRVAPDGRYQETWQMREANLIDRSLQPDQSVVFLASPILTGQTGELAELERTLAQRGKQLLGSQIRILDDGQRYLQTGKAIAVELPSGKTVPQPSRLEELNRERVQRATVPMPVAKTSKSSQKVELPSDRSTTAPIAAREFVR
jgi:hypothetical protein